ncbi:MAG: hypothetical protein QXU18_06030 [Thermoplasmatales archaeon]
MHKEKVVVEIQSTRLFGESPVKLDDGENIIVAITPLYRLQKDFTGPSGVYAERFTENAIIVTSKRVMFVTLQMP